ncbi:MAG: tetratricopeptide repeat protein [Clostridium sp.]
MENSNNLQSRIDSFLNEHKIKVRGGEVHTAEDMSSLLNTIAQKEIDNGNYEKGLYFAIKSFEFDKKNLYSIFLQGLGFRLTGKYEKALKAFEYCNRKRHDLLSFANIGFCFSELKNDEQALDIFNKIIENTNEEVEKENAQLMAVVYECMGNIYLSREDVLEFDSSDKLKMNYKLAVKYYKNSLRLNRSNHVVLNKLAACYYHFDDERKALYCYEEAAKAAPEEKNYIDAVRELKNAGVIPDPVEF